MMLNSRTARWILAGYMKGQAPAGSDPDDRLREQEGHGEHRHVRFSSCVVDSTVGMGTERRLCLTASILWPVIALQASEVRSSYH